MEIQPGPMLSVNSRNIAKKNRLNNCQEITIAKICVQNLADYCIGKRNDVFN